LAVVSQIYKKEKRKFVKRCKNKQGGGIMGTEKEKHMRKHEPNVQDLLQQVKHLNIVVEALLCLADYHLDEEQVIRTLYSEGLTVFEITSLGYKEDNVVAVLQELMP
jgi:DNA-directed RNA polymerase alpha subunit